MKPETTSAGLMPPISGIVLIMKTTHAIPTSDMDYKGIGVTGKITCRGYCLFRHKMLNLHPKINTSTMTYNFDEIIERHGSGAIKTDRLEEHFGHPAFLPHRHHPTRQINNADLNS